MDCGLDLDHVLPLIDHPLYCSFGELRSGRLHSIHSRSSSFLLSALLIMKVFTFGSVPLKTYLPDANIDLAVMSENETLNNTWAIKVSDMLKNEEKNESQILCERSSIHQGRSMSSIHSVHLCPRTNLPKYSKLESYGKSLMNAPSVPQEPTIALSASSKM